MPKLKQSTQVDSKIFTERLQALAAESGLSQRKLSVKADLNPTIVGNALHGTVPSMRSIIKLADTLNCSLPYIIGESDIRFYQPAKIPTTFHKRLVELTAEKNVKYSDVSKDMPFAHNAVYEWLRTETIPSLCYMKKLAEYFGVSLDYITGRTDVRN
ncbi:MAG: helix-turn-helix domain-containing protein [Clostridia bacterium]|nr:helix-turn-helix domain-containing protein [Clostridia bacterium]MCD8308432.1 helix-turn-helix domain-containing protein [Clostridia bacterium]